MTRALVVEDNAGYRAFLLRFLETLGFEPIYAADAPSGFKLAVEEQPRLMFVDWCLRGQSGLELVRILRRDPRTKHLPLVLMSSIKETIEDEVRALGAGADRFFVKDELTLGFDKGARIKGHLAALVLLGAQRAAQPEDRPNINQAGDFGVNPAGADASTARLLSQAAPVSKCSTPVQPEDFPYDMTVLVIDDEEDTSELLGVLLKGRPYRIVWAQSGAKGLSLASTELPDLVVLDLHMPGLDGQEICRRLREGQSGLRMPILMLTGEGRVIEQVRSLNIGADDYLLKGSPNEILEARIRALIRGVRFGAERSLVVRRHGVALSSLGHELSIADRRTPLVLTKTEAAIMALLMSAIGNPVAVEALHKKVSRSWKPHSATIKVHISNIRGKLGRHAALIEAINGDESYRFNMELAESIKARPTNGAKG